MVMPLVASFLIAQYGWRFSYMVLGVGLLGIVFSAALFLRRDPAVMGTVPYGFEEEKKEGKNPQNIGASFREALPTRQFWILCLLSFCDVFLINVIVVHIVPYARGSLCFGVSLMALIAILIFRTPSPPRGRSPNELG